MYDAHQNHSLYFGNEISASAALFDAAEKAREIEAKGDSVLSVTVSLYPDDEDSEPPFDYTSIMVVDHS